MNVSLGEQLSSYWIIALSYLDKMVNTLTQLHSDLADLKDELTSLNKKIK